MSDETLIFEFTKNRDPKLREQIIVKFLPVVKYVIARMNLPTISRNELEDIHSAGILGLIRALEDFDISKNVKFKTYATLRVRGNILDYLRQIDYVSRSDRAKLREIENVISVLTNAKCRKPTDAEIVNHLSINTAEYHRLIELAQLNFTISLDQIQIMNNEEVVLSDVIADKDAEEPFENSCKSNMLELIKNVIKSLPERQRTIVIMYYLDCMTLLEIGKVINLSESRVSRILGKAILTIRNELKQKYNVNVESLAG